MRSWTRRGVAVLVGVAALLVASPGVASAHPLGNFTLNRYSGIIVGTDSVTIDHILDIAEIPTAQRKPAIDTSDDGTMSTGELRSWSRPTCRDEARGVDLRVDGADIALAVERVAVSVLPGQASLPILRVECALEAVIPTISSPTQIRVVDTAAGRDVGWKEMTVRGDATTLTRSDVPERTRSKRLTAYPKDLLTSPLDEQSAQFEVRPGGPALQQVDDGASAVPDGPQSRGADRLTRAFEGLLQRADDGPLLGLVALLGAMLLGAAHAVAPGHGKTIMAFYLSGRRQGALRAAATVGATVTATHTAGVLALGVVASVGTALAPAKVYPWLSVASGLLVVAVGLALLRAARRGAPGHTHGTGAGQHTHGPVQAHGLVEHGADRDHPRELVTSAAADPGTHAGLGSTIEVADVDQRHLHRSGPGVSATDDHEHEHDHEHDHDHDHDHEHDHSPPAHTHEVADLSPRGLVAIGLAGGLLPSPSAVIVFLGALGLGRPWFGVALVVAFGIGMATTLATVGVLVMRLRERAERRLGTRPGSRFAPLLRMVPVLTAAAVIVLGAALAVRGFSSTGLV